MGFVRPDFLFKNCRLKYNERKYTNNEIFDSFKDESTHPNPKINIDIKPIIRIFPKGVSCTLKVIATHIEGDYFQENEVYKILHLVGMNQNCAANYIVEYDKSEYDTEYDVFTNDGDEDEEFYTLENNIVRFTLFNLFRLMIRKCILNPFKEKFERNIEDEVSLLCAKHLIQPSCNEDSNIFERTETQSPWVVSNLELTEDCYRDISSLSHDDPSEILGTNKAKKLKKYQRAITPLVFRTPDLSMKDFTFDTTYYHYSEWESDYLPIYSIHFDNRLFVQMSRRSILTLTKKDGIIESYPGKYFIPGLLDVSELVRVRWQTLLLLNYLSDRHIRSIKTGEFFKPVQESSLIDSSGIDPIIDQIYQLSTCLDSPSSYVVSGDALREIQERLNDTFRVRELTSVVLKKADILERLRSLTIRKRALESRF